MTVHDVYWIAGLLEGEGCFRPSARSTNGFPRSATVLLGMTDRDVVDRFAAFFGKKARPCHRGKGAPKNWKPMWRVCVPSKAGIGLMMTIHPLMGERRQAKIREVLRQWRSERACLRGDVPRNCTACGTSFLPSQSSSKGRKCGRCRSRLQRRAPRRRRRTLRPAQGQRSLFTKVAM